MIARRSQPRPRRRGIALIEMTVAGMLVVVGLVATVQVVGWVAIDRRAVERRERAVLAASNLLERAAGRTWDEQTAEALGRLGLAEATASSLPGAALTWGVVEVEGPSPSRRITVEIRWRDRTGRPEAPVRLVAWSYRREAAR